MNQPQVLSVHQRWSAVAQGLKHDLADYAALRDLLGEQHRAALRHDAPAMQQLAERITQLAERIEHTRRERVAHVRALLPPHASVSMSVAIALLPPALRRQFDQLWQRLVVLVQACKDDNQRNGSLIVEQAELMQSVLRGARQEPIYAPV